LHSIRYSLEIVVTFIHSVDIRCIPLHLHFDVVTFWYICDDRFILHLHLIVILILFDTFVTDPFTLRPCSFSHLFHLFIHLTPTYFISFVLRHLVTSLLLEVSCCYSIWCYCCSFIPFPHYCPCCSFIHSVFDDVDDICYIFIHTLFIPCYIHSFVHCCCSVVVVVHSMMIYLLRCIFVTLLHSFTFAIHLFCSTLLLLRSLHSFVYVCLFTFTFIHVHVLPSFDCTFILIVHFDGYEFIVVTFHSHSTFSSFTRYSAISIHSFVHSFVTLLLYLLTLHSFPFDDSFIHSSFIYYCCCTISIHWPDVVVIIHIHSPLRWSYIWCYITYLHSLYSLHLCCSLKFLTFHCCSFIDLLIVMICSHLHSFDTFIPHIHFCSLLIIHPDAFTYIWYIPLIWNFIPFPLSHLLLLHSLFLFPCFDIYSLYLFDSFIHVVIHCILPSHIDYLLFIWFPFHSLLHSIILIPTVDVGSDVDSPFIYDVDVHSCSFVILSFVVVDLFVTFIYSIVVVTVRFLPIHLFVTFVPCWHLRYIFIHWYIHSFHSIDLPHSFIPGLQFIYSSLLHCCYIYISFHCCCIHYAIYIYLHEVISSVLIHTCSFDSCCCSFPCSVFTLLPLFILRYLGIYIRFIHSIPHCCCCCWYICCYSDTFDTFICCCWYDLILLELIVTICYGDVIPSFDPHHLYWWRTFRSVVQFVPLFPLLLRCCCWSLFVVRCYRHLRYIHYLHCSFLLTFSYSLTFVVIVFTHSFSLYILWSLLGTDSFIYHLLLFIIHSWCSIVHCYLHCTLVLFILHVVTHSFLTHCIWFYTFCYIDIVIRYCLHSFIYSLFIWFIHLLHWWFICYILACCIHLLIVPYLFSHCWFYSVTFIYSSLCWYLFIMEGIVICSLFDWWYSVVIRYLLLSIIHCWTYHSLLLFIVDPDTFLHVFIHITYIHSFYLFVVHVDTFVFTLVVPSIHWSFICWYDDALATFHSYHCWFTCSYIPIVPLFIVHSVAPTIVLHSFIYVVVVVSTFIPTFSLYIIYLILFILIVWLHCLFICYHCCSFAVVVTFIHDDSHSTFDDILILFCYLTFTFIDTFTFTLLLHCCVCYSFIVGNFIVLYIVPDIHLFTLYSFIHCY